MKLLTTVSLLALATSLSANAYDQPEVKFYVELTSGGRIVECPVMDGSLGDSMEVVLTNGMKIGARAAPVDENGRSAINLKIYSMSGALAQEFNYAPKLSQQKPSFEYRVAELKSRITVVAEGPSLLPTTRNHPSWREFDTRTKPNNALGRTNSQPGCASLLGAAQRNR